jgi:hypothetical protein
MFAFLQSYSIKLIIAAIFFASWSAYSFHLGEKNERSEWETKEIIRKDSENNALLEVTEKNRIALETQQRKTKEIANDYEIKINKISHDYVIEHNRNKLRVSKSICDPIAMLIKASDSGIIHDSIGGIELPGQVENNLWDFAESADKEREQLNSIKKWIIENGFY